jgi:hypothetical protein
LKPIPEPPGMRTMCPDNCRYRDRLAPFCGYCMLEILGRKQDTEEKDGEIDTETAGQAREKGL